MLRALDVLRALHGLGRSKAHGALASRPSAFHSAPFELEAAHRAPPLPGIILLSSVDPRHKPGIVWTEAALNLRERLDEMLRLPQAEPALEALLAEYPRKLVFRALVVVDADRRARLLRNIRTILARKEASSPAAPLASGERAIRVSAYIQAR